MRSHSLTKFLLAALAVAHVACESPDGYDGAVAGSNADGLWTVSGDPAEILQFQRSRLRGTGVRVPDHTLATTSALLGTVAALAFDDSGRLWVSSLQDGSLLAFTAARLEGAGPAPADVVIEAADGSLAGPVALAFDRAHGLWVANHDNGTLVRFTAQQLAASGAPRPAVTITGPLQHPTGLAFDSDGALWVSDNTSHVIARYDPGQLVASGSPDPADVIESTDECLAFPSGLAFDRTGRLWVANAGCDDLLNIDVERPDGSPDIRAVRLPPEYHFGTPTGLAFDAGGDLWVLGFTGTLTRLSGADLDTTVLPVPVASLELAGRSLFWSLAFWPPTLDVPIG